MIIRAHHLLCMRYFEGRGYSEEFVSNFYKIIDEFGSNPVIQVVNYPEVICGKCPYNINSMCTRNDKDYEEYVMTWWVLDGFWFATAKSAFPYWP